MQSSENPQGERARVVIVDDDRDIAEVMRSVLVDEGYEVTCLQHEIDPQKLRTLIANTRPDCVLLDGIGGGEGYGESWDTAAWLSALEPSVPVVMVTGHLRDAEEARASMSVRAWIADFAAVVGKPFELDDLLAAVSRGTRRGADRRAADATTKARTSQMIERLRRAGAREISSSSRRAWVTFRTPAGELMQLYLWELLLVYFLGRYTPDGRRMEPLGEFTELEAAIALALPSRQAP